MAWEARWIEVLVFLLGPEGTADWEARWTELWVWWIEILVLLFCEARVAVDGGHSFSPSYTLLSIWIKYTVSHNSVIAVRASVNTAQLLLTCIERNSSDRHELVRWFSVAPKLLRWRSLGQNAKNLCVFAGNLVTLLHTHTIQYDTWTVDGYVIQYEHTNHSVWNQRKPTTYSVFTERAR